MTHGGVVKLAGEGAADWGTEAGRWSADVPASCRSHPETNAIIMVRHPNLAAHRLAIRCMVDPVHIRIHGASVNRTCWLRGLLAMAAMR
jgi:hypothetical protein